MNYKLPETSNSENGNQLTSHWQSGWSINMNDSMNKSNLISIVCFYSFIMQIATRSFRQYPTWSSTLTMYWQLTKYITICKLQSIDSEKVINIIILGSMNSIHCIKSNYDYDKKFRLVFLRKRVLTLISSILRFIAEFCVII